MGNCQGEAMEDVQPDARCAALPRDFQAALDRHARQGSVCAVSRVAQDGRGAVTHVEWGVTSPWLDDWVVGPRVADAQEVFGALAGTTVVWTLFPTCTGFALGPELRQGADGTLALAPGPEAWTLGMLARLFLTRRRS